MDMNQSQKPLSGIAADVAGDVTCICQVLSVRTEKESKVIKLRITNEEFELGRVFGGTEFNNFGIPTEFSNEFEISNSTISGYQGFGYHFQIYRKTYGQQPVVIRNRIYTYAQSKHIPWNGTTWVIKSVSKLTA